MRRTLIATALVAGLATVAVAHAAAQSDSAPQWATVNQCGGNAVGVRASMPGDGSSGQMRVRFTAQWYSPQRGWVPVSGVPSSPWVSAGSGRYSYGQAGWTFQFDQPKAGSHPQIRAVAELLWAGGRSATLVTSGGASGVDVGGSQASCTL
jgi:hypothetical protein